MKETTNARHYFIELISYWEGSVNSSQLMHQFALSRQQCSTAIKEYAALAPTNLIYSNTHKAHLATRHFSPLLISNDVNDYLHWLQNGELKIEQTTKHSTTPCEALKLPARQVAPKIIRALIEAIKKGYKLKVDYVSLNNPSHQSRTISPHSFISTGLRWHLRAYCEKSNEYRDFVLSRFRGEPKLIGKTEHNATRDTAWNTNVTLHLQADPRLNAEKRAVIEQDYQMQNGQLQLTTKGCLVNYLLRELQINTKMLDGNPDAQQLVIVNLSDIKPWLFE